MDAQFKLKQVFFVYSSKTYEKATEIIQTKDINNNY